MQATARHRTTQSATKKHEEPKIYDRRNRIVHKGIMDEAETNKVAGIYEAIDAVECAIALVDWFGELGGYISPLERTHGMVACHLPVKRD
jgi:hypothetical protein